MIRKWIAALAIGCLGCSRSPEAYTARCTAEFEAGRFGEAVLECRKAIQKRPDFAEAFHLLGRVYVRQGKGTQAYDAFSTALRLQPANAAFHESYGDVALAALQNSTAPLPKLYAQALESADWLLTRDPNSKAGLRLKGALALLDRRPNDALPFFQKAHSLWPDDSSIATALSQALFESGDFSNGERIALGILRREKSHVPAYDLLYAKYSGAGRWTEAERILVERAGNVRTAESILRLVAHHHRQGQIAERDTAIGRLRNGRAYPGAVFLIGDFYASAGNTLDAVREYESGITAYPDARLIYGKKIVKLFLESAKDTEALARAESLFKDFPKDSELRALRATLLFERGSVQPALAEFRDLVKAQPNDAILHYNFGRALIAAKDWEGAKVELQHAARIQKDMVNSRMLLAEVSSMLRQPQEAVHWAQEVLKIEPESPRARLVLGIGLAEAGQTEAAHREIQSLFAKYPQSFDVRLQLGLMELSRGRFAEADKIFRSLNSPGSNDVRPLMGLSESLFLRNQVDQAFRLLDEGLKEGPNPQLARTYAILAGRAGKHDLAIEKWKQVLAAEPSSVESHLMLGEAYRAKGEYSGAIRILQTADQLKPRNPAVLSQLAYAYQLAGDAKSAKDLYRQVAVLQPQNAIVQNNLASLLVEGDLKEVDEALSLAQRAVKDEPKNLEFADTLGMVYLRKNMADSALQIFSNLVRQSPGNPSFRHHLALTFLQKGDKEKARTELQTALTRKPAPEEEKKIRDTLARL